MSNKIIIMVPMKLTKFRPQFWRNRHWWDLVLNLIHAPKFSDLLVAGSEYSAIPFSFYYSSASRLFCVSFELFYCVPFIVTS